MGGGVKLGIFLVHEVKWVQNQMIGVYLFIFIFNSNGNMN